MSKRRRKPPRNWGAFHVQVWGTKRWTTLRGGYFFGHGYTMTRERAKALAEERRDILDKLRAREGRIHRVQESPIEVPEELASAHLREMHDDRL
jgi:hypothetical protein